MKLDKLASIAEIVSSIAIVFTLAYLAVQTQQTNRALFANSREATMTADVSYLLAVADYPELNVSSTAPLEPLDRERLETFTVAFFRIREFAWFQYQEGILDDQTWESYSATTARFLREDRVAPIWQRFSSELDQDFVAHMNERVSASQP